MDKLPNNEILISNALFQALDVKKLLTHVPILNVISLATFVCQILQLTGTHVFARRRTALKMEAVRMHARNSRSHSGKAPDTISARKYSDRLLIFYSVFLVVQVS